MIWVSTELGFGLSFDVCDKKSLGYIRGYWGKRSALDSNDYHNGPRVLISF